MQQESHVPPPIRKVVKAKRRFGTVVEKTDMAVRELWKEKVKSHVTEKVEKQDAVMNSLQSAFENMTMSPQTKKVKYQGGYYTIHTGEKGGKYIVVNGEKKYLRHRK